MEQNKNLAILTESSNIIGTGHLLESMELYKAAKENGFKVVMFVSADSHKSILGRLRLRYIFFRDLNLSAELRRIKDVMLKNNYKLALFNLRKITNSTLTYFTDYGIKTACIDELGNRRLDCQAIINPTIVKKHRNYALKNQNTIVYSGPEYLCLNLAFAKNHPKCRVFKNGIRTLSVCMGGVDHTGVTLRLIDILAKWSKNIVKNIILGGGFTYGKELRKKIKKYQGMNFKLFQNVADIASFFINSDVVFTAGGNTLYELACCGTPAIVLYEDKHEKENGIVFQEKGFGYCLGQGTMVKEDNILRCLEKLQDPQVRNRHSRNGKKIVDGKGCAKVVKILSGLTEHSNG